MGEEKMDASSKKSATDVEVDDETEDERLQREEQQEDEDYAARHEGEGEDEGENNDETTEEGRTKAALRKSNARLAEAERHLELLSEDRLQFGSLVGSSLESKIGEFTYKFKFFKEAMQDSTKLGVWKGWAGRILGQFENGTRCWGGPDRSLNIKFECGLEEAIVDVTEPSRCVYEATVMHPGACDSGELAVVDQPRVVGPKDEL